MKELFNENKTYTWMEWKKEEARLGKRYGFVTGKELNNMVKNYIDGLGLLKIMQYAETVNTKYGQAIIIDKYFKTTDGICYRESFAAIEGEVGGKERMFIQYSILKDGTISADWIYSDGFNDYDVEYEGWKENGYVDLGRFGICKAWERNLGIIMGKVRIQRIAEVKDEVSKKRAIKEVEESVNTYDEWDEFVDSIPRTTEELVERIEANKREEKKSKFKVIKSE